MAVPRRTLVGGVLLTALTVPLMVSPLTGSPASAAGPTSITIQGHGLPTPLEVRADADPELFRSVLGQVAWMSTRVGQTTAPPAERLGPRYTIVVLVDDKAKRSFHLYPLAEGGPRAHRPAKQPDLRKMSSAWFFGRLSMSETLRVAGVPLPIRPDALNTGLGGGIGGGAEDPTDAAAFHPADDVAVLIDEWRRLYLLNGAVILLIAAGLAGFSLLVRPKDLGPRRQT